jgi:hypothetical protein
MRFWALTIALCFVAALTVIGIKFMFDSVGASKHTRYEPVDVPPAEISPRHGPERKELERREKVVEEETK